MEEIIVFQDGAESCDKQDIPEGLLPWPEQPHSAERQGSARSWRGYDPEILVALEG